MSESSNRMDTFRYIGHTNPGLVGETAMGRWSYGTFLVQVDRFDHPMSHRWWEESEADWEVINYYEDSIEDARNWNPKPEHGVKTRKVGDGYSIKYDPARPRGFQFGVFGPNGNVLDVPNVEIAMAVVFTEKTSRRSAMSDDYAD